MSPTERPAVEEPESRRRCSGADGGHPAVVMAAAIADQLADPGIAATLAAGRPWWAHHLAHGAVGIALLHVERAAAGLGTWQRAHDWLAYAARAPLTCGPDSHFYYGAPALAFACATVAEHQPGAYCEVLRTLDGTVAADTIRRVSAHHRHLDAGHRPVLADFDLIRGVTGLGAYLLYRTPANLELVPALAAVLSYLVRLAAPTSHRGVAVPGWWTLVGPHGKADDVGFPGGHANAGVAHGIGGPLALLALAARAGVTVPGHTAAITTICAWLDHWRVDTPTGPRWPYWITLDEHCAGPPAMTSAIVPGSQRPSWCYGTAGLARAQQLAALATGDVDRQHRAENAAIQAFTDPPQRAAVVDASLCHGFAGMAHVASRMASDAHPPTANRLQAVAADLLDLVQHPAAHPGHSAAALLDPAGPGPGLLDGAAGIALAVQAPGTGTSPRIRWDACLLLA